VNSGQEFVSVTKVVLANLSGGVSERFEQIGDRGVFFLQSQWRARQSNGQKTRAERMLSCNERSASCGATLLGIVISEERPLIRYAVDVARTSPIIPRW
jgi:hypothetical protein